MNKKISKELLAKAMGDIDDRFIDNAHRGADVKAAGTGNSGGRKRSSFSWKWVTAAAAVLVFIVAGTVIMIKTAGSRLNMRNGSDETNSMYAPGAVMHNGQKSDAVSPGINMDPEYGENLPVNSLPSGNGPTEAAIVPDSLNVYSWYDGDTYRFTFMPAEGIVIGSEDSLNESEARNYTEYALQNSFTSGELLDLLSDSAKAETLKEQIAAIKPLKELVGENIERKYGIGKNAAENADPTFPPSEDNQPNDVPDRTSPDNALSQILNILGPENE
ncbi:MAG: hypothetical protein J6X34_10150 [Clostridia bacterium]|nr:hypothetical protein [Clostridia bacterium]